MLVWSVLTYINQASLLLTVVMQVSYFSIFITTNLIMLKIYWNILLLNSFHFALWLSFLSSFITWSWGILPIKCIFLFICCINIDNLIIIDFRWVGTKQIIFFYYSWNTWGENYQLLYYETIYLNKFVLFWKNMQTSKTEYFLLLKWNIV